MLARLAPCLAELAWLRLRWLCLEAAREAAAIPASAASNICQLLWHWYGTIHQWQLNMAHLYLRHGADRIQNYYWSQWHVPDRKQNHYYLVTWEPSSCSRNTAGSVVLQPPTAVLSAVSNVDQPHSTQLRTFSWLYNPIFSTTFS